MHECCISNQKYPLQRRSNGLQLPLNFQQVIGWLVFVVTGVLNFTILARIQFEKLELITNITFAILYVAHIVSNLSATLLDPSEEELRKSKVYTVPEFDRSVHAHVIENGRCHLCNIYTSGKKTKHCSLCNKCVDRFDHHCKWLNSCVGRRNYRAFIASVVTALLLSLLTFSLCLYDLIIFLCDVHQLSHIAQGAINCTTVSNFTEISTEFKWCKNSVTFLLFLIIFGVSALAITCALVHLFCFHIYISILGVSTYEYIVQGGNTKTECTCNSCRFKLPLGKGKLYAVNKLKGNKNVDIVTLENAPENSHKTSQEMSLVNQQNVASLIGVLVNSELNRAKKLFLYDKNKIHPELGNS